MLPPFFDTTNFLWSTEFDDNRPSPSAFEEENSDVFDEFELKDAEFHFPPFANQQFLPLDELFYYNGQSSPELQYSPFVENVAKPQGFFIEAFDSSQIKNYKISNEQQCHEYSNKTSFFNTFIPEQPSSFHSFQREFTIVYEPEEIRSPSPLSSYYNNQKFSPSFLSNYQTSHSSFSPYNNSNQQSPSPLLPYNNNNQNSSLNPPISFLSAGSSEKRLTWQQMVDQQIQKNENLIKTLSPLNKYREIVQQNQKRASQKSARRKFSLMNGLVPKSAAETSAKKLSADEITKMISKKANSRPTRRWQREIAQLLLTQDRKHK